MRSSDDHSRPVRQAIFILTSSLILTYMVGCSESNPTTPTMTTLSRIDADQPVSYRDIDPSYWIESPATRALDPYDSLIQPFRDRKVRDLANPDAPLAFEGENRISGEFRAPDAPWDSIESVLPFEWSAIEEMAPTGLEGLRRAVRFRTVLRHPDFRIVEVAMAPHAILPLHALAEPSAFHVVAGRAEFEVENETIEAFVGTTIKLEPYETRAIRVTSEEPFRALWFRWAPGGDETYLDFGYYLTGTNFHVQPLEATFPTDYEHWPQALRRVHHVADATPRESRVGSNERDFFFQQNQSLAQRREMNSDRVPLYTTAPRASDETSVGWIDFSNIAAAGFFWAGDAASAGNYLDRWNEIARMKGIFQARNPGAQYDFNFSYIALGPMSKYVTHSHATPEFYYVLDGETEWILDGETFTARPGHVYFHGPYRNHEMRGLREGEPMRAITGSWAPFGDRDVWAQPGYLLEPLPKPNETAEIPDEFDFHRFARKSMKFESTADSPASPRVDENDGKSD